MPIPAEPNSTPYEPNSTRPTPWRRGRRVLVAEDDVALRALLQEALESDGWDVLAIADGFSLVSELSAWLEEQEEAPADFLVTDVWMPGVTGIAVLEGLLDLGKALPTVVMSAAASSETEAKAIRCGASAFFCKPFDVDDLTKVLRLMRFASVKKVDASPSSRPVAHAEEDLH